MRNGHEPHDHDAAKADDAPPVMPGTAQPVGDSGLILPAGLSLPDAPAPADKPAARNER